MIRPSKGQTNAAHPGILQRPPVREGPQGPPLRAGGRPDPAADLRRHAQAGRPAPAGAGAGGEARRRTQLRPRRSPPSGGEGHPRAEAGPWHRGPRSVDRLAGGPARQRPHAQARDGGRAAGRAPDHRAGAGGARRAQRDRRGDRGAGGDPSPPGAEDASRRAGHRGGLAVPLRAGARGPQQRPAESARRADGSLAREPRPLVAGPRPARALVRRPPAHPAGDQAPRRQGGGEGSEPALERDRGSPDASALTEVEMDRLFAVEIVYRGIFQKKLAANISRAIVLAAHKEGKPGISFGRYGDSPERNGIPAKYFAIVATDETTLEEGKAKYEPKEVDISICVDDTLFKGVESWAWYGLQPINKLLKPGGTLIVTSLKEADQLIPLAHRKETAYKLAVLKGTPSFSGLWVYKDDHTDVRILGVMARGLPELFSLGSVQETIRDEWKNELKATSALRAFERVTTVLTVTPALRIPMVAMVGNRALDDPGAFGVEHNDALAVRDLGWQLVWVDNAQEALDTALIAYRVAEDRRVFLPCAIACDGAFLTHSQALVKIPSQEKVDQFLPRYDRGDLLLHPDNPITVAPQVNEDWLMEIRRQTAAAMERSPTVIREAYKDFERIFGRSYGNPFFEEYMTDDADAVLVGMGTLSTPVKVAIRQMRAAGKKVGFVRVRWFRPFAAKDLAERLGRFKAVGGIDRGFSVGCPSRGGIRSPGGRNALYPAPGKKPPVLDFICGLGGREVTVPDVERMTDSVYKAAEGKPQPLTQWIGLRE